MPKIPDEAPPKALLALYRTVPFPESQQAAEDTAYDLHNLQCCGCGHDRCCHSDILGTGERQVLVVNCPRAGRCLVKTCRCAGFEFSARSSAEGRKRREQERKIVEIVPPEAKGERAKKEPKKFDPFA